MYIYMVKLVYQIHEQGFFMKKNIALYLKQFRIKSLSFFALVVLAFLIGLTSCGSNPSLTNLTPIYQGMTIERPQAAQNLRLEANSDSGEEPGSGEDVKIDDEDS